MPTPTTEIDRLGDYNVSVENVSYTFRGPDGYGYVVQLPNALSDLSVVANWISEIATTLVVSTNNTIDTLIKVTQAEYDAIVTKDPSTMYAIIG